MRYQGSTRIPVRTSQRNEMIDVTPQVEDHIQGKLRDGFVMVFVPHTTAAVTIKRMPIRM